MSEGDAMARLGTPACLAFPFRVGAAGPAVSRGADYVREQIEQVLFTTPGERVFRSEFGAGVKTLTFEPNNQPLWEVTRRQSWLRSRPHYAARSNPAGSTSRSKARASGSRSWCRISWRRSE